MDDLVKKSIENILNKNTTVTSVAKEFNVSRQAIYKWIARYKKESRMSLSTKDIKGIVAHNKVPSKTETLVIALAKKYPKDSVLSLSKKLDSIHHIKLNAATIFRVLKRNDIRYTGEAHVVTQSAIKKHLSKMPKIKSIRHKADTIAKAHAFIPTTPVETVQSSLEKKIVIPRARTEAKVISSPVSSFASPLVSLVSLVLVISLSLSSLVTSRVISSLLTEQKSISLTDSSHGKILGYPTRVVFSVGNNLHLFSIGTSTTPLPARILFAFSPRVFSFNNIDSWLDTGVHVALSTTPREFVVEDISSKNYLAYVFSGHSVEAANELSRARRTLPLIDQLSLSFFCSLASLSTSVDTSRCNYAVVSSGIKTITPENITQAPSVPSSPFIATSSIQSTFVARAENISPVYVTKYVTEYVAVPGPAGKDGSNGRDGKDGISPSPLSVQGSFGGFVSPSISSPTPQSLIGVSTIGYLKGTLIDYATFSYGTSTNMYLANANVNSSIFNGYNTFNDTAVFTGTTIVNSLTATTSTLVNTTLTNSTTTTAYVDSLTVATSTISSLTVTNASTTNATTTNLSVTNLETLNASTTNSTTTNAFITNLTTALSNFINLFATNATTTNFFATSSRLVNATSTTFYTDTLSVGDGTVQGNQTVNGNFTVNGSSTLGSNTLIAGSVTLGTSTSNNITVNGLFNSSLIPNANNTYDLGSPSFYWRNGYLNTLNVNTLSAGSTTISGTQSNNFTINTDNVTTDGEDSTLVFYRGTVPPNAVIKWNATTKRFEFNQSTNFQDETPSTGSTTLSVQAGQGQSTRDLFKLLTNGGATLSVFNSSGYLGIGSSTPNYPLTVTGNTYLGGNLTATGTLDVTGKTTLTNASTSNITISGVLYVPSISGLTSLSLTDLTATNSTTTLAAFSRSSTTNAFISNASTTNLSASGAFFTSFFATNASTSNASSSNLSAGGASITNFFSSNASTTNLSATGLFSTSGYIGQASSTALTVSGQTILAGSGGNVGINTVAPLSKLQINLTGATGASKTSIDTFAADGRIVLFNSGTGASTDGEVGIFGANSDSGEGIASGIGFARESGSNWGTQLRFYTHTTATDSTRSLVERMRIDGSGNVGIGTTTPSYPLTIKGANTNGNISVEADTSAVDNLINFTDNSVRQGFIGIAKANSVITGASRNDLVIRSNGNNIDFNTTGSGDVINMIINSSGNVGIGTSTPSSTLHVIGTGVTFAKSQSTNDSGMALTFGGGVSAGTARGYIGYGKTGSGGATIFTSELANSFSIRAENALHLGTNGDNIRMTIDTSGNVGVGATTPRSKLEVVSGTANINADIAGTVANFTGPTPSGQGSSISIESNDSVSADTGGVLGFGGRYSGTSYANWASIKGLKTDGTSGNYGGYLSFYTRQTGNASGERMRIDGSGNVGIGTTSPGDKLDIAGGNVRIEAGNGVNFYNATNGNFAAIKAKTASIANAADLSFSTGGATDAMFITNAGNVGIGTVSPISKLTVAKAGVTALTTADLTNNAHLTLAGTDALVRLQFGTMNTGSYGGIIQASYDNGGGGNGTEPLLLNPLGGNVGIGSTSPAYTLGVAGTLGVTGAVTGASTITGTTLNGTTGINTGAGAGTQRIDASGNMANIGTISSGLINSQTISSAANFTGTVNVTTSVTSPIANIGGGSFSTFGALNVQSGNGSPTTYRDIDMKGAWSAGEGHAITASYGTTAADMVGQIVFQHDAPGSRIKFGRLYDSGNQSTYPMELVSNGSSANLTLSGNLNSQTISSTANFTGTLTTASTINSTAGPYQINGISRLATVSNYTTLNDASGRIATYLGDAADPGNYYDNTTHWFRSIATSNFAHINSSGITVDAGSFNGSGTGLTSLPSSITTAANATWGGQLTLGGNGGGSGVAAIAKVQATDGNLHLDAGTTKTTYLNYYSGTGGVLFGTGASGLSGASVTAGGVITGTSFTGAGTGLTALGTSNFSSANISQWTNNSGYITAASSDTLTNKSGNISQWTNNAGYITTDTIVRLTGISVATTSTNWSKPSGLSYIVVELWGGGGGGGGVNASGAGPTGGTGGSTSFFGSATSTGGVGGGGGSDDGSTAPGGGANGGTGSGSNIILTGNKGVAGTIGAGGIGGNAPRGGIGGSSSGLVGQPFGGGGAGGYLSYSGGGGGGGGGYTQKTFTASNLAGTSTVRVIVGAGGTATGANDVNGGAGGAGGYVIYEYTTVATGADVAENYPVEDPSISPGEIVSFDKSNPLSVKRAVEGDTSPLAGIISTNPGVTLDDTKDGIGKRPVALSGRVPTKVTTEGGAIKVGDRITLSSVPGVGKKATQFDDSVGIAITPYDGEGVGTVTVFMNLQKGLSIREIGRALLTPQYSATSSLPTFDFVGDLLSTISLRVFASSTQASSTPTSSSTPVIDYAHIENTLTLTLTSMQGITSRIDFSQAPTDAASLRLDSTGGLHAIGFFTPTTSSVAELYTPEEAVDSGTLVTFSTSTYAMTEGTSTYHMAGIKKATSPSDIVGVVTTSVGLTTGTAVDGVPVVFSGRVRVQTTDEYGLIQQGDNITISTTTPGKATKAMSSSHIGIALSSSDESHTILIYLLPTYQTLDTTQATTTNMLTTGNIDLNVNGVALTNIKSLASANGSWSIDEHGRISAKVLCLEATCIDGEGLSSVLTQSKNAGAVVVVQNFAYLLNTKTHTLRTLDITNPGAPVEVASFAVGEDSATISQSGSYLYITNNDTSRIYLIDITSPRYPNLVSSIATGSTTPSIFPEGSQLAIPDATSTLTTGTSTQEETVTHASSTDSVSDTSSSTNPVSVTPDPTGDTVPAI